MFSVVKVLTYKTHTAKLIVFKNHDKKGIS